MYLGPEIHIVFASPRAFAANRHKMVGIKRLDETRGLPYPFGKRTLALVGKRTRLIGNLPSHDGRRLRIRLSGDGIVTSYDIAHMLGCQSFG